MLRQEDNWGQKLCWFWCNFKMLWFYGSRETFSHFYRNFCSQHEGNGERGGIKVSARNLRTLTVLSFQVGGSWINIFKYMSFTLVSGTPRSCFRSCPVTGESISSSVAIHVPASAKWWAPSSSSFDVSLLLAALAPRLSILKRKMVHWLRIYLAIQGGDTYLIPGQGTKIPHAEGQLSLHATMREKPMHRDEDPMCRH